MAYLSLTSSKYQPHLAPRKVEKKFIEQYFYYQIWKKYSYQIMLLNWFSNLFFFFKGKYGCLVKKLHPEALVQQISTTAVDLQLSVLVPGMENQPAVLAPVKKYQYLPPFYVHNSEVSLSTAAPLSSIRVSTIPDLSSCIQVQLTEDYNRIVLLECEEYVYAKKILLRLLTKISQEEHFFVGIEMQTIFWKVASVLDF